ncbi:MAG TPA: DUF2202 domain-containing protein [Methanoregulaceae archaeon]|jgi:hypothetical protein|nr:DUF2202 domain-containing protein [Methanoregulaceae archaeon]NLH26734.1 DUF2202 domain-containing protein [Methanomicrobiales archaeon]HNB03621.1 DUF2202 domain-containing protein [Methanoregulaceae archaeon]HNI42097.1 DUF2202 domain-containing protein [Methanoregulaceae archaeon]HOU80394.1 DUF2202 domain-containing protein [Methanoregulaceae archaeon]
MIRNVSVVVVVLLILAALSIPVMAAGGNGGSGGADGADAAESGGNDNAGSDASGNAGTGATSSTGQAGPQAQTLQEEQERNQQETVDQPGIQIIRQDQDQTQGRTGVDTTGETTSPDTIRQKDRDTFLQQVSQLEQNLSRDQDRDQAHVDLALSTFAIAGSVTGGAGPELSRLAGEINQSLAAAYQAEQQMSTRSSFMRMLIGGDREAAGLLIQSADQNQQRIQAMEQLLATCSDCDPQVRVKLEEQVQTLSQEQNRLLTLGQQEQADRGLFSWLFGGSTVVAGTGQATPLTDDEKYWMTYMREEEKLARDVYLSLGARWNLPLFTNIAQSEQVHMDSVKTLLDRYGIPDPAAGKAQGAFTDPALQDLYDDLIAQGSASPVEALKAGVIVEETDIADLNKALATTEKNDIRTVYNNLLQGSMNHLNAFQSNLASY